MIAVVSRTVQAKTFFSGMANLSIFIERARPNERSASVLLCASVSVAVLVADDMHTLAHIYE